MMESNLNLLSVRCLYLINIFLPTNIYGATMNETKALHTDLMTDYNKYVRPVNNQSEAVSVQMGLTIIALQEFDEVLEKFSVVGVFHMQWKDENLVWDTSIYSDIEYIFMGYKDVWVPEIILTNPSMSLDSFGAEWQLIRYSSNGSASWFPGDLIKATCSVNVYYFPYDIQECDIQIYAWAYRSTEVILTLTSNTVETHLMPEHGSWKIISTKADVRVIETASRAIFTVRLERKPQYVLINVIFPILFLCLLNILVFLLPAESGERISYAITALLAIAVYMTIVSDNLPKTSEPVPIISYLLLVCLCVSALMAVVAVLNMKLFHKNSATSVPGWLCRFYRVVSCSGKNQSSTENKEKDLGSVEKAGKTEKSVKPKTKSAIFPKSERTLVKAYSDPVEPAEIPVTWQDISSMVDKISAISSTAILFVSYLVFFMSTSGAALLNISD